MRLRTHDRVHNLKLNLGETLIVEFCPLGANEPRTGGPFLGFTVSTMCMPGGKMATAIKMPDGCTFEEATGRNGPLVRYLIDNPNGADEMTLALGGKRTPKIELAVKRVTRKGCARVHGGSVI